MLVVLKRTSLNYHNFLNVNRPSRIINRKQKKELTNGKPQVKFFDQICEDAQQCFTVLKNPSICHLRLPQLAIVLPFICLVEIIKR